jgi:hypothetical protein
LPDGDFGIVSDALNVAFPPLAMATILSGVLPSLGTRWGLFEHYWIVTKLVLTVGVIATAVQVTSRLTQAALADPSGTSPYALLALPSGSGRPTSWQDVAAELGRLGGTVGDLLRRLTAGRSPTQLSSVACLRLARLRRTLVFCASRSAGSFW